MFSLNDNHKKRLSVTVNAIVVTRLLLTSMQSTLLLAEIRIVFRHVESSFSRIYWLKY